jgi:4-amino-4-deoxy-L-arabinose transferase-like glycosyltransferase
VAACVSLLAVVHARAMTSYPAWFDDEGTYVAQAWAVETWHDLAHYTYWYDHPPLGWLVIAAWTWPTQAFERTWSVVAGRELMLVVHIVSCLLVYVLARRLGLRRGFAAIAVALFSLSPLAIHYQRMVLLDNIAVAWLLAAFVLASSPGRRLAAFAGSGACSAAAVLTKETTLLVLPALLVHVWLHTDTRTRAVCLTVFGSLLALIAGFYPLYAILKGELLPGPGHVSLFDAIAFQLFTRASSGAIWDQGSDAYAIARSWVQLDPWLLAAGIVAAAVLIAVRRFCGVALALLIPVLMLLRPGYLPIPYVIALLPFAALTAAALVDRLWAVRRVGPVAAAAVAAAAAVVVAPAWATTLKRQTTPREPSPAAQAAEWVAESVPRGDQLIVDNTAWVDLVERGFPARNVVWFWKLDLDPGVSDLYPGGYRAFDYVVSSDIMRASEQAPVTNAAIEHSCVVATFGRGETRVEVRRIGNAKNPRCGEPKP